MRIETIIEMAKSASRDKRKYSKKFKSDPDIYKPFEKYCEGQVSVLLIWARTIKGGYSAKTRNQMKAVA